MQDGLRTAATDRIMWTTSSRLCILHRTPRLQQAVAQSFVVVDGLATCNVRARSAASVPRGPNLRFMPNSLHVSWTFVLLVIKAATILDSARMA